VAGAGGVVDAGGPVDAGGGPDAACTPATVRLNIGVQTCKCGGTCAPCPTANGLECGATGNGHGDWYTCTVGGQPYFGCAMGTFADAATFGYCCQNNCSSGPCQP
jgi:hypothetical protein